MNNVLARYYMIGGFLGAGKTTAVAALAQHLAGQGQRVGLITNDQGSELVDTAMLRARGFATEEIPGGCFCCRFPSLMEATRKLSNATRPDAFVAEPVGSCTDLIATVSYPLRRIYGDQFQVAPLSVLVDPVRAEQVFGWVAGRRFSEKVLYIWRKQVEEADIIVLAKTDLLEQNRVEALRARFVQDYPGKPIAEVSVRSGSGVAAWFDLLEKSRPSAGATMELDYDRYADGEALLGWLNATIQIASTQDLDATALLLALTGEMKAALSEAEIAHLKATFSPSEALAGELAAVSVVRSDIVPELTLKLDAAIRAGEMIVNCRAECAPEELFQALRSAVSVLPQKFIGLTARVDHVERFRPGRPQPTHRLRQPESLSA